MKLPAIALVLALAGGASPALASDGHSHYVTPCGAGQGGLPDPAETAACLAARYKAPKPRPSPTAPAPAPPPAG